MDEAHNWSGLNRQENVPLDPDQQLTVEDFLELQLIERMDWNWEFDFWDVPYRKVELTESLQSVCKYIARHTHNLQLETNHEDLFNCRAVTHFQAIKEHIELKAPEVEITPATEIHTLNGRMLYQAYFEIFRSLPLPDKSPVNFKTEYKKPKKLSHWLYHTLHKPIDLSTFAKKVILPFAAIEAVLWTTFPDFGLLLICVLIPLYCLLIGTGITLMDHSYQMPENIDSVTVNNAPTLKEMCKQLSAGLNTT